MSSVDKIDSMGGLDYIKKARFEGKTQRETAEELGYNSHKVISNYLKKYNIVWSDLPCEHEPVSINKLIYDRGGLSYIINMKNQGYTLKDIANDLGYKSIVPLNEYFKRNNIIWKNLGFNKTSSSNRVVSNDKAIIDEVKILLDDGYTLKEILDVLGLNHPYVNNVFRRNGLSLKKFIYREHETPFVKLINEHGGVNYLKGKSISFLSDEFGYSYNYTKSEIRDYLKGTDFKIRGDVIC